MLQKPAEQAKPSGYGAQAKPVLQDVPSRPSPGRRVLFWEWNKVLFKKGPMNEKLLDLPRFLPQRP